jgi:Na+/proline symporter
MQVGVTMGGVAVAAYYLTSGVDGGAAGIVQAGEAAGKFETISWAPNVSEPTVWVFIGMFFGHIFTQLGDQPQMQRMLASTDAQAARRTVITGNLIGCVGSCIFFSVGTSLWAFYRAHPDRLAEGVPQDAIFPYFIANELPHGVVGLIIAGLFAAAMGALSSALNATAAIIVSDFQGELKPNATPPEQVRLARRATLVCGVIATGMAFWLAWRDEKSLWDAYLKLTALIGGGFPGVFALGLLSRRANAPGVLVGALASIGVTWWVQTYTSTNAFLHVFVAVSSCAVIGYVASLAFAATAVKKDLRGLTMWDRTA